MKTSTLYNLVGGAFLSGAIAGAFSTCNGSNDLYYNLGQLDQLEERMQQEVSPEECDNLRRREITVSKEMSKNRINTIELFLLTVVAMGAAAYTLRAAHKKEVEEDYKRRYRSGEQ